MKRGPSFKLGAFRGTSGVRCFFIQPCRGETAARIRKTPGQFHAQFLGLFRVPRAIIKSLPVKRGRLVKGDHLNRAIGGS